MKNLLVSFLALIAGIGAIEISILLINVCINLLNSLTYGILVTEPGVEMNTGIRPEVGAYRVGISELEDIRPKNVGSGAGHLMAGFL